jgi:prepilin-type N-terminal cleavage/methylation domain-containing protein
MIHSHQNPSAAQGTRKAFTLIELLVVLGIIGLLAAILFPAFRRAQESGAQANCASNLKQIYQAVELYRQDEKFYPSSLAFLLPNDSNLDGGANTGGTGFFKGGRDALVCNNDDSDASIVRSSYGDISYDVTAGATDNMSRYLWNYWGYRAIDGTNCTDTNVSECAGTAYSTATQAISAVTAGGFDTALLLNPAVPPTNEAELKSNPIKNSLSNRFAPTSTVITHCVYHRLPTAGGKISAPFEVTKDPENGALARDIVLRRDGSAKVLDISKFHMGANTFWATQNF